MIDKQPMTDFQKSRVYRAENLACSYMYRKGLKSSTKLSSANVYEVSESHYIQSALSHGRDLIHKMISSKWFQNYYGLYNEGEKLDKIRLDSSSNMKRIIGNASKFGGFIRLGRMGLDKECLVHEIAHIVAPSHSHHGPDFCRVLIELSGKYISRQYRKSLEKAMKTKGVVVSASLINVKKEEKNI